jgi:Ca2+-binding EF-hand superfamily protein
MGSKSKAHDAFRKIDKDRSGSLDAAEFKLALKLLNLHLSAKQTHAIMMHLDDDGDGTISLDEFMRLVWQNKLKLLRQKLGAAAYAIGGIDVEKLYQHYDRDSSGELDFEEFRRAVRKDVGMTARDVPDDELYEMFVFVDTDGGGKIGLEEFAELMPGDETHASRARHASVPGQAFSKILESADERRANMLYLFHRFDTDGSGGLDREEFRHAMLSLEVVLSVSELDEVMEEMDNDGNGFVTAQEFSDRMRVAKKDRRIVEGGTGGGGGGGRGVSSGGSPRRRQRRTKAVASPRRITGSSGSDKRSPGRRPATVLTPEYSRQRAALESEVAGLERWVAALEVRQQGSAAPGGDDSDGVSNSGAAPEPEPEPQPEPESKREHGHDSSGSLSPDGRHSNSRQSRASPSSTSKHSPKQEATAVNLARAQQKQQLEQWLRDEQQVEAPVDLVVAAFDHAGGFSADEWLPTLQAMSTYDRDAFLQVRKRRSFAPFYT